jgi:hypothetical protein
MYGGEFSLGGANAGVILAIVVAIVLVLVFLPQITHIAKATRNSVVSAVTGANPKDVSQYLIPDEDMKVAGANAGKRERMNGNNQMGMGITDGSINPESSDLMQIMGYGDDATWDEVLKTTELDPATFANHQDFVKDVRRFSSGANFTSVTDDNTNSAFTNFVGLRRPQQVDIGASARQQPDIDQSVLKRNKPLYWGYAAGGSTYLTAEQNGVPAGQYQYDNAYEGNVQNAENFVNW